MEKIVIIGANSFQNPLILKAKEMGFETHVFAWKEGAVGEDSADVFYPISIVKKDEILEKCRDLKPKAVVSIASDLAAITVNYVAKALGLPANSEECVNRSTNKYLMRKCFSENGVNVPKFVRADTDNCLEIVKDFIFPVIVKPTDRSGSRSITKVEKKDNLIKAVESAVKDSFENKAIIEEYIDGEEYSFEAITFNKIHKRLAITKKFTTGSPHYIETGHIEPSGLSETIAQKVEDEIFKALDALGIETGASHSEFKINSKDEVRIIEVGARMGGDCIGSDLVRISTGYDYVRMVIDAAMGIEPVFEKVQKPKTAIIRFMTSVEDIEQYEHICHKNEDKICFVSDINIPENGCVIDSSSRYGYYIMAVDKDEAEDFLKNEKE